MSKARVNEILSSITAFNSEPIGREEYLPELKKLQTEIINLTFNEEHASTGDLRIWDVEKHFQQLNETNGNVAETELAKFIEGSRELANLINAEISGSRGEFMVFNTLRNLRGENRIIRNLEVCGDEYHTEIDGIVVTQDGITIIEVKNSVKNIYIDEKGNFYRTGCHSRLDCNIADKMGLREQAVRDILEKAGFEDVKIKSLVVFTNSMIEVVNRCQYIRTIFLGQMLGTLENEDQNKTLTTEEIDSIAKCLGENAYKGKYYTKMDIEQYKLDFATLMSKLEEASFTNDTGKPENVPEEDPEFEEIIQEKENSVIDEKIWKKSINPIVSVVGTIVLSAFTTLVVNHITGRRN